MPAPLSFRSISHSALCLLLSFASVSVMAAESEVIELKLRSRQSLSAENKQFQIVEWTERWDPKQTAVIVCDMWDLHHCLNATRRGAELAPRMNQVLHALRDRGVAIIHAPSACMDFYKDHPARLRAQQTPLADNLPEEIGQWCRQIPEEEQGVYPIDQSDSEDDDPLEHEQWVKKLEGMGRNPRQPWIRQTDSLDIETQDYISDSGEAIWSILEQHDIDNVVLLSVHTNMCVLGRPFGLRNMARYGKNVVLMRDMTDTMYNPKQAPYVSHFTGTDLIVEHIEKWVCPTITSDQVIGGTTFVFSKDVRPHLLIVCSEPEYKTEETLPPFAASELAKEYRVSFVLGDAEDGNLLPGLTAAIEDADVLLVSVRRRALPEAQLQAIREYVAQGKPVIGIRTANHAFSLRGKEPSQGHATWENWDQDVFGGNYSGHHGNGLQTTVRVADGAEDHPILKGVDVSSLTGHGSLYKVSPLNDKARPLLMGSIPDAAAEPVAWTATTSGGGRAFYTSLGHASDFEQPAFRTLLTNAIDWATRGSEGSAR